MANGQGIATIDFGSYPGTTEAYVAVTGQTSIQGTSKADAYIMADDTSTDHTANDHRYVKLFAEFTCGNIIAGTGFTIYAMASDRLTGKFTVRWVWTD